MMDTLINVKMAVKQLERASLKSKKAAEKEKSAIKKAIENGDTDGARIYAENAIRNTHEAKNYLRLSSKMKAVQSRLETAEKGTQISQTIGDTVPVLLRQLEAMTPEQIMHNMDSFEQALETLDVQTAYTTSAIDSSVKTLTPENEVDKLIQQVGDEHCLDVDSALSGTATAQLPEVAAPKRSKQANAETDSVDARLAALKG
jgi:charged multivesicular body protein 1